MHGSPFRLVWPGVHLCVAYEPTPEEVARHAPALAVAYSDPYNGAMMSNSGPMTAADVIDYYAQARRSGTRTLLLERDGVLVGDADLRHLDQGRAEAAILIASRATQGQGLGTKFGIMLHVFAFRALELERLYVAIIPANVPSQRLFRKLGYTPDASAAARAFAEAPDDLTFTLARAPFEVRFAGEIPHICLEKRA